MNRISLQKQMYLGALICLAQSIKSGDGTFYQHARYMMTALRAHKFTVTIGLYNATQGADDFISPKPSQNFAMSWNEKAIAMGLPEWKRAIFLGQLLT